MGLTPDPVNAWFFAWVAIAPLWILILDDASPFPQTPKPVSKSVQYRFPPSNIQVRSTERLNSERLDPEFQLNQRTSKSKIQNLKSKILYALAWGIGYHGLALFWITGIHPMTWMGVPWFASLLIAAFCWIFITLWGAAIVVTWTIFFTWLLSFISGAVSSGLRVLLGVALWIAIESLWSYTPLYWTSISYTQSPVNLAILHLGQLSGPLVVSAAIVVVNGLLAEAWMQWQRRSAPTKARGLLLATAVSLLSLHLCGYVLYNRPLADDATAAFKVGIIQGNVPNTIKLYEAGWRRAIEGYTTGYKALADQGVDVVLTPETALPTLWVGQTRQQSSFYRAILGKNVPVWLGAFGEAGRNFTNSLFTIDGNGETLNEYRKVKLVPLGEYIPFQQVLGALINRLSPLDAELEPGAPHQIVNTPFGRAIAAICYESAFPEHFRRQAAAGGSFIITASNDAHYSATMPAQHHAQDLMRAIETDRWEARATNTGYSAIVDPHGRTHWISDLNTYALHAATLYRRQTQTLYVSWGDWFTPMLLALALVSWARQVLKNTNDPML